MARLALWHFWPAVWLGPRCFFCRACCWRRWGLGRTLAAIARRLFVWQFINLCCCWPSVARIFPELGFQGLFFGSHIAVVGFLIVLVAAWTGSVVSLVCSSTDDHVDYLVKCSCVLRATFRPTCSFSPYLFFFYCRCCSRLLSALDCLCLQSTVHFWSPLALVSGFMHRHCFSLALDSVFWLVHCLVGGTGTAHLSWKNYSWGLPCLLPGPTHRFEWLVRTNKSLHRIFLFAVKRSCKGAPSAAHPCAKHSTYSAEFLPLWRLWWPSMPVIHDS